MSVRPSLALGWFVTLPGLAILLALAILVTPVFGLIGCKTAGILSISCESSFVFAIADAFSITVLVAASFPPVPTVALAYSLGFAGWPFYIARDARK